MTAAVILADSLEASEAAASRVSTCVSLTSLDLSLHMVPCNSFRYLLCVPGRDHKSGTRSAWQRARVVLLWQERLHEHPRSGQVGTVAAPLSESPSLCAAGTERGWPAGPCGTSLAVGCRALMSHVLYCDTVTGSVKLWGSGALALLLRGPRLQAHGHCH